MQSVPSFNLPDTINSSHPSLESHPTAQPTLVEVQDPDDPPDPETESLKLPAIPAACPLSLSHDPGPYVCASSWPISRLSTSTWNSRKASSIRFLDAGSAMMVRLAAAVPVRNPVSPPRNRPPVAKAAYVSASPQPVGRRRGVKSGRGSVEILSH